MFDAQAHFALIERVLATDQGRFAIETKGVIVEKSWQNWYVIQWRATIRFLSGHELEVLELYRRTADSILKSVSYHFMDDVGKCIFRFDTHGHEVALATPCHIHLGETEETFENGHGRLCGFSLETVDFLEAFRLAHSKINSNRLPWE